MNVMTLSAALSFGRLLTDAYSLQNRLDMVVIVDACSLPSSEAITEEECACVVLPSRSDTVCGNIRSTTENLPVCLTAAAPVFLNWRLRNLYYDMI